MTILFLLFFAFCAGTVDAVVGGGGLIQLPALLVFLPQVSLPVLLGTNKVANLFGTGVAAFHYARAVGLPGVIVTVTAAFAVVGAFCGALSVSMLDPAFIKPIIVLFLVAVLLYTFMRKDLGAVHAPKLQGRRSLVVGALFGLLLGYYDGFLGPGTGSFLIFGFVLIFGFNFFVSSGCSKVVNAGSNVAAITFFAFSGDIDYALAVEMGFANMAGSLLGSRFAMRAGVTVVRRIYLCIVTLLILKLGMSILMS